MATDQFCLRWNNFQVNITSALESLKCDEDLVDVTLTCEGQNVKAHKVILSACSPYFRNVFKENPCQHPVVILKDVKYEDVTALLNFMYQGEVYITQDRLAPFLHTAELLQVRGLAGATNPFKDSQTPVQQQPKLQQPQKLRKVPTPSIQPTGPSRHATPPLCVSPAPPPPASKSPYAHSYRPPKSPVIPSNSKESFASAVAYSPKEKPRETLYGLSHEADPEHPKSFTQGSHAVSHHLSPTYHSSSSDQPSTSSQVLSESSTFIPMTSPASYQRPSRESSPQQTSLACSNISLDEQNVSQPSSPQPASVKRRKTLPRRLSSSHVSLDDAGSPVGNSDTVRNQTKISEEHSEQENQHETISVKQEHFVDDSEDLSQDDNTSSVQQINPPENDDMEVASFYNQHASNSDDVFPMEQNVKDEESAGASETSSQSMLLRSLVVSQQQNIQADGNKRSSSGKVATLPHVPQCGTCPHCGQVYSNQSALKYHVRLMHTDMTNRHCCHLCPRSFALREVFKAHMWSKHKQRC